MDNEPQQPQPEVIPQTINEFQAPPQPMQQPQVTDTPLFTAPTPTPVEQPKPKKSHKGLIYAIVALLLLGGGLAGGWLLFGRDDGAASQPAKTTTAKTTTTSKNTPTVATLKPEDVTTKIKTTLATEYTLVGSSNIAALKSKQISVTSQTYAPAYKTTGYNYYTTYSGGSTLYITGYSAGEETLPTTAEKALRSKITSIYTTYGLTKTETHGTIETASLVNIYTGKGLVCTINDSTSQSSPTTASCGLIEAYKDAAATAKPFADVLTGLTSTTVLGVPTIKDSKVSGYQTAEISGSDVEGLSGHVDLFYRKTSGAWKYFTGTQSELACSKYNTTDLKNAYMGDPCWDTTKDKDSTVQ